MNRVHTKANKKEMTAAYATADELCKLFAEQMDNLHLLAFLLTAEDEKAQRCIVSAIVEFSNGTPIFRQWARAWARRTIIKNAIRIVAPRPNHSGQMAGPLRSEIDFEAQTKHETDPTVLRVLRLDDFERFVTVMSVFEQYSDNDCAVLLDCAAHHIQEARERALQNISAQELAHSGGL